MSVKMKKIDASALSEAFDYDPRTGVITNRVRRDTPAGVLYGTGSKKKEYVRGDISSAWEGMPAEVERGKGRYDVKFRGRWLPAARVAWALHYGEYPDTIVDHINRDPLDNRIDNLRMATAAENSRNRSKKELASSKYLGVTAVRGKWKANIKHAGVSHYLGTFDTEEKAALAYDAAAITFHREFANPSIMENPYLT